MKTLTRFDMEFRMPFGKYRNKTLSDIEGSDEGLRYIHFMALNCDIPFMRTRLRRFLSRPTTTEDLTDMGLFQPWMHKDSNTCLKGIKGGRGAAKGDRTVASRT